MNKQTTNKILPNDYVQVVIQVGDKRFNGKYKVISVGDDAKGNTWSTLTSYLYNFKKWLIRFIAKSSHFTLKLLRK